MNLSESIRIRQPLNPFFAKMDIAHNSSIARYGSLLFMMPMQVVAEVEQECHQMAHAARHQFFAA